MLTCARCSQKIPSGRSYCTAHYLEELARYEADLARYQAELAAWKVMSPTERQARDEEAEKSSVAFHAGVVGFILGCAIWYVIGKTTKIDALLGTGIVVACVGLLTAVRPLRRLVGRATRIVVRALIYFVVIWLLGALLSVWSVFVKTYSVELSLILLPVSLGLSVYLEISGGHHASGEPRPPTKPSP